MQRTIPNELQLLRGGVPLGTITPDPSQFDFPWYAGLFSPSERFAEVRPLFERELELLNNHTDDLHWDAWNNAWEVISQPGLQLLSPDGIELMSDPLIHIDGAKTWWR